MHIVISNSKHINIKQKQNNFSNFFNLLNFTLKCCIVCFYLHLKNICENYSRFGQEYPGENMGLLTIFKLICKTFKRYLPALLILHISVADTFCHAENVLKAMTTVILAEFFF